MFEEENKDESIYNEEAFVAQRSSKGSDQGIISGRGGYAELFETVTGQAIECGYFVTLRGAKIEKATSKDRYILGVTSISAAILSNGSDVRWKNKYLTDSWGKILYDDIEMPEVQNAEGVVILSARKEHKAIVNTEWDEKQVYIPRTLREEWIAVTLLGQVQVRDDGTCKPDEYCIPNDDGVATTASRGYRVLERRGADQIIILLRANTINTQIYKSEKK